MRASLADEWMGTAGDNDLKGNASNFPPPVIMFHFMLCADQMTLSLLNEKTESVDVTSKFALAARIR